LAKVELNKKIEIVNRKASFEYHFIDKFIAGMVLTGTEIKSIRLGNVNLGDAFCFFINNELFIKNMHIGKYEMGTHYNHEPMRDRKLLLNRTELKKIEKALKEQGTTVIPYKLFINEKGIAKIEIALAKGKKLHDKRESLKEKDTNREIQRAIRF
jgi:SsrA-binding protein